MKKTKFKLIYDTLLDYKDLEIQLNDMLKEGYQLVNVLMGIGVFKKTDAIDFKYVVSFKTPWKDEMDLYSEFGIEHVTNINEVSIYKAPKDQDLFSDEALSTQDLKKKISKQFFSSFIDLGIDFIVINSLLSKWGLVVMSSNTILLQIAIIITVSIIHLIALGFKIYFYITAKKPTLKKFRRNTGFISQVLFILLCFTLIVNFSTTQRTLISIGALLLLILGSLFILYRTNFKTNTKPTLYIFGIILVTSISFGWNDSDLVVYPSLKDIDYQTAPQTSSFLLSQTHLYVKIPENQNSEYQIRYYEVKETPFKNKIIEAIDQENGLNKHFDYAQRFANNDEDRSYQEKNVIIIKKGNKYLVSTGNDNLSEIETIFNQLEQDS